MSKKKRIVERTIKLMVPQIGPKQLDGNHLSAMKKCIKCGKPFIAANPFDTICARCELAGYRRAGYRRRRR